VTSVAVLVVTYNSAEVLPDLLASLPSGLGDEVDWQLVVADNGSTDDTLEVLRTLAPASVLVETGRNGGYAAGINAAAEEAGRPDAYLVLNPDVRLDPGCVPTLLTALADPAVGIVVPRLRDAQGELILSLRREPSLLRAWGDALVGAERVGWLPLLGETVSDPDLYRTRRSAAWAEGSTQLVSAACWARCSPWDESFFLYSEETDFGLRAGDAGFQLLYEPAAGAVHLEGGSAGSPCLWALVQLNRVRLYGRRHGSTATVAFWLATALREASRTALGREPSRAALRALLSPRLLRETPGPHTLVELAPSRIRSRQPVDRPSRPAQDQRR
jgi:N-acetylglucosaminyl-diphospho-decaprenol L-rhamnosyltransferase